MADGNANIDAKVSAIAPPEYSSLLLVDQAKICAKQESFQGFEYLRLITGICQPNNRSARPAKPRDLKDHADPDTMNTASRCDDSPSHSLLLWFYDWPNSILGTIKSLEGKCRVNRHLHATVHHALLGPRGV